MAEAARLGLEALALTDHMELAGYFLIVYEIAKFCHDNNILAQGRGSAANSVVCYALKITNADPIEHNLAATSPARWAIRQARRTPGPQEFYDLVIEIALIHEFKAKAGGAPSSRQRRRSKASSTGPRRASRTWSGKTPNSKNASGH